MTKTTPKFIYFDLGNVLLFFDHHLAARQMAEIAGITEERVWEVVFESKLEDEYEAGRIDDRGFYQRFCDMTETRPDFDALLHAAANIFELNVPIVPVVAHLFRGGNRLGILSNTNEAHWRWISSGRYRIINDFFSVTALSFKIGGMKPEPHIYLEAARMAQVDPTEIFYTDDREENVVAACHAGFDAVLFRNAQQIAQELRQRNVRWNF